MSLYPPLFKAFSIVIELAMHGFFCIFLRLAMYLVVIGDKLLCLPNVYGKIFFKLKQKAFPKADTKTLEFLAHFQKNLWYMSK